MTTFDLDIRGMSCAHCVKHVRDALGKVPGIDKLEVEIGHARLEAAPAVTEAALVKALAATSYAVVKTSRS